MAAKKPSGDNDEISRHQDKVEKTNPSVTDYDQYKFGEPRGSVPMSTTMRKPDAYYPAKRGPK